MNQRLVKPLVVALCLTPVAGLVLILYRLPLKWVHHGLTAVLVCTALVLAAVAVWRLLHKLLFKVGRRLAFSYFLIGLLPIPMVLLVLGVVSYLLSSFFLGHLYRDSLRSLASDLAVAARTHAAAVSAAGTPGAGVTASPGPPPSPATPIPLMLGIYRDGRRVGGDPRLPTAWPPWADESAASWSGLREREEPLLTWPGGSPTLGVAALAGKPGSGTGVIALLGEDLARELSRRSELWVEIRSQQEPEGVRVEISNRILPIIQIRHNTQPGEAQKFFKGQPQGDGRWNSPALWWAQTSGPLLELASGRRLTDHLLVTLNGTPRTLARHLFSISGEIDAGAWFALLSLVALLANVYLIASVMAVFMIVGLSRAVNRMSRATDAVRRGDFTVRIPVRRRDQVGELQRSFNEMAANLETLVAASAQKELLDKELALARDLQKSLIPSDLPAGEGVELATLFEPSAAIGGDYFDVLRLSEHELAVIIADVSGHGLSTGLRMAMLKAALLILIEQTREPTEILRRLDAVVRADRDSRFFVTATLAILDLRRGVLDLTNAGHPPTYRIRRGQVEEFLLPSSPLGGLGHRYGRTQIALEPEDVLVWLSDGLIEAANASSEPFGYDRVLEVLAGPDAVKQSATAVRNRLLAAVESHVAGEPPSDDRTLVVLRWRGLQRVPSATREQAHVADVADVENAAAGPTAPPEPSEEELAIGAARG